MEQKRTYTGCIIHWFFSEHKFFHLLGQNETEGITNLIQYFTSSFDNYKKYLEEFAPMIREKAFQKWGNQFISFSTVMKIVN